ncbi:MAG TPA: hypothetical protein VHC50_03915, partial [Puia sp.]|nr:hypothetical protein [Puia sp.]
MTKTRFSLRLTLIFASFAFLSPVLSQSSTYSVHFLDYQKSLPRVNELINRKEDTLRKQFRAKQLIWPARYIYIRSF